MAKTDWKQIGEEVLHMMREDEAVREVLASTGELFQGYSPVMEKVHLKHAERLKAIIDEHGFPTIPLVGEEAANAAVRLVLHAISWPEFMRAQEVTLVDLAKEAKVSKKFTAMLVDRIRFYEGRKQVYGTNSDWDDNGILRITDVESGENINALNILRASMDLSPIDSLVITPLAEYHPPNPRKRHEEYLEWTHKVGWRKV